ncbi:hypothetical protein AVEN_136375-1 [Araneus ventricosus]|uniref:Uncharacterized protein n=2 Tax=Araneus ventricosus TaxID=182803 RepID=A0A4Y2Q453_ARAVE|nr:hypothetical protein AVEN_136375-1 [Araneus ventricosus]
MHSCRKFCTCTLRLATKGCKPLERNLNERLVDIPGIGCPLGRMMMSDYQWSQKGTSYCSILFISLSFASLQAYRGAGTEVLACPTLPDPCLRSSGESHPLDPSRELIKVRR